MAAPLVRSESRFIFCSHFYKSQHIHDSVKIIVKMITVFNCTCISRVAVCPCSTSVFVSFVYLFVSCIASGCKVETTAFTAKFTWEKQFHDDIEGINMTYCVSHGGQCIWQTFQPVKVNWNTSIVDIFVIQK